MIAEKVRLSKKAGGSIIRHKPVFSFNSRILYVGCESVIKSFSTTTGEHVQDIDLLPNKVGLKIVDIISHPFDKNVILCCFENSCIVAWSSETNDVVHTVIFVVGGLANQVGAKPPNIFISASLKHSEYINAIPYSLTFYYGGDTSLLVTVKFDIGYHTWSITGPGGKQFLAGINKNRLTIINMKTNKIYNDIIIGNERRFTCVTCHPTEECVAVGDNTGRVILYYEFLAENARSPQHIFHWHTLPVNDIAFSQIGSNFYSGGSEHVLVKWSCHSPEVRYFLPRLSAPIVDLIVSPGNELVAVSTSDNGILIVDSQQHVQCCIQQFTWGFIDSPGQKLLPCGLVVDSRSNSLVTNGRPGHIQFYSTQYSSLVYNMDIVGQNYISCERNQRIANSEVIALQFSSDSTWLATSQLRNDPEIYSEALLKFWFFDRKSQTYKLKSCVTSYHEISKILFQPINEEETHINERLQYLAVTLCGDNKFRVWTEKFIQISPKKRYAAWNCDCIGYYRDHPLYDICFSSDGSILGAAFGSCFTLWDVVTNTMKCSLARGLKHLRKIAFGYDDCSFIAVSADDDTLFVWNLLSLTIMWTFDVKVSLLVADPFSSHIAIFTPDNNLLIFKLTSSKPVFEKKHICDKSTSILSAVYFRLSDNNNLCSFDNNVPWLYNSTLYFLNSQQELMAFEAKSDKIGESLITVNDQSPLTPFQSLLTSQRTSAVEKPSPKEHLQFGIPWAQTLSQFLSPPAHTMPPVHLLCGSILQSFLISKPVPPPKDNNDGQIVY